MPRHNKPGRISQERKASAVLTKIKQGAFAMMKTLLTLATLLFSAGPLFADSYYADRLDDATAIYLTRDSFPVHADGVGDDSDALQQAINKVQETTHQGIVFIPEGQYRLGKTVYVWNGIRLIGYGGHRPVFILRENTAGFLDGSGKYMVHFVSDRPAQGRPIRDANPGAFYSAMSNIDI